MSIIYLILSLIFLVIGIQFLRGKWLQILNHRSSKSTLQLKRSAEIVSPGLIGMGTGLFLLGFCVHRLWLNAGNVIFLLSLAYLVIIAIWPFIRK